jgi:hypothetical protein
VCRRMCRDITEPSSFAECSELRGRCPVLDVDTALQSLRPCDPSSSSRLPGSQFHAARESRNRGDRNTKPGPSAGRLCRELGERAFLRWSGVPNGSVLTETPSLRFYPHIVPQLLFAARYVGVDTQSLAEVTRYSRDFINKIDNRMRAAGIWVGDRVDTCSGGGNGGSRAQRIRPRLEPLPPARRSLSRTSA